MKKDRKPNRLKGYDYSTDNLYYITSCVDGREQCFGAVIDKKMILNEIGIVAKMQMEWLQQQYPYIVLHEYEIMPDHVHAILEIDHHKAIPGSKIKSISEIIGAFKTTSSKKIRENGKKTFAWQRSFHDRIIRSSREQYFIAQYINDNPKKWNNPS